MKILTRSMAIIGVLGLCGILIDSKYEKIDYVPYEKRVSECTIKNAVCHKEEILTIASLDETNRLVTLSNDDGVNLGKFYIYNTDFWDGLPKIHESYIFTTTYKYVDENNNKLEGVKF